MSAIQFRLAARTDAAGKYNPNAPWEGNEDNMFVDSDLAKDNLGEFTTDKVVNLSDRGCLMVVADGMGGMNAGEVASAIAIKTVMEHFTPERLTDAICKDSKTRIRYLETVVVAADSAIKKDSRNNPDHEGMGSTIILAWLCDDEICLTWCGDSRAYLFHPDTGLAQVSKDHSYVQGLVDDGKITEIEAFDHPYGNIITRSLGDPDKKAKPESKCFKAEKGDVFMLCSDGLSGVLRDRKTYDEEGNRLDSDNLEDIITDHRNSMIECMDSLYEAAQRNDWYDNVTVVLCEIVNSDPIIEKAEPVVDSDSSASIPLPASDASVGGDTTGSTRRNRLILFVLIAVVAFTLGGLLTSRMLKTTSPTDNKNNEVAKTVGSDRNPDLPIGQSQGEHSSSVEYRKSTIDRAGDHQTIKEQTIQPEQKTATEKKTDADNDDVEVLEWNPTEDDIPSNAIQIANDQAFDEKDDTPNETEVETVSKTDTEIVTPKQGISEAAQGSDLYYREKRLGNEEEYYDKCKSSCEKCKSSKGVYVNVAIDNCIEYLKKFKEGQHRSEVEKNFEEVYLYGKKIQINQCHTEDEVVKIMEQHDRLMVEIGMKSSLVDKAVSDVYARKKNQLNN